MKFSFITLLCFNAHITFYILLVYTTLISWLYLFLQGINRAQLTLQELQDLAERQRKQILYNSKELMEKQQQLMKMHQDFRTRLKKPDSPRIHAVSPRSPVEPAPSPRGTKLSPKSPVGKREQDQYAKMLRETYSSVSRMQGRNSLQKEVDVRKFSNVELGT